MDRGAWRATWGRKELDTTDSLFLVWFAGEEPTWTQKKYQSLISETNPLKGTRI